MGSSQIPSEKLICSEVYDRIKWGAGILWLLPPSHLQSFDAVHVQLKGMSKTQGSNVDGRCDGARDECQGSERGNKPLRLGVTLVSQPRALCRTQSTSEEDETFYWVFSLPFLLCLYDHLPQRYSENF